MLQISAELYFKSINPSCSLLWTRKTFKTLLHCMHEWCYVWCNHFSSSTYTFFDKSLKEKLYYDGEI